MNPKVERLKAMADELREMFPNCVSVQLDASAHSPDDKQNYLKLLGHHTYESAVEAMRELGVGVRTKQPYADSLIYTQLSGTSPEGLHVTTFPDELPPCCHIEVVTEKIPKQQTVDSGEFIEIERKRVVCA